MKANRYLHDPRHLARNARQGRRQEFPQRRTESECIPSQAIPEDEILNSTMLNYPLTQYMFCAPDEGAAAVVDVPCRHRPPIHSKPVFLRAVEVRTRRYGAYEVNTTFAPVEEDVAPTVYAAKAAFEKAGVAPEDVDVIQLQDTDAGAEIIHMAECGFCADGEQEKLLPTAPPKSRCDAGQHRRWADRQRRADRASGLRQIHELVRQFAWRRRRPPGAR